MLSVIDKKSGVDSPDINLQVSGYVELLRNGTPEGLTFDEEHHIFTVNGKVIPSVTTVLKRAGLTPDYSMLDPWYAKRGTYIHRATELWEAQTLDEDTVDDEIRPYLEAYKRFRADYPVPVKGQEVRLWHPHYRYAGIIDMVTEDTSSYKLFLKKTGKYKLVEVKDIRSHFNFFLSALITVTGHEGAGKEIAETNLKTWRKRYLKEAA
jgi:hypothetical protein